MCDRDVTFLNGSQQRMYAHCWLLLSYSRMEPQVLSVTRNVRLQLVREVVPVDRLAGNKLHIM